MVEGGGLENRCTRKGTVGSNPTSSAITSCVINKFAIRLYLAKQMFFNLRFAMFPFCFLLNLQQSSLLPVYSLPQSLLESSWQSA